MGSTLKVYWLLFPYFLFTLAFGGTAVPKLDLYLSLICRDYLAGRASLNPGFVFTPVMPFEDSTQCRVPAISALATNFTLYISLITGILAAVATPKLGALSDRYGRKVILAVITCGGLLNEIVTIIAATLPDSVNYHWLLLGACLDGMAGSLIASTALMHSYASDCTPPAQRAIVFGYFHVCMFGGVALGPLVAGLIVKTTGNMLTMFYLAFLGHLIYALFVIFLVPESLSRKRQLAVREKDRITRENTQHDTSIWSKLKVANFLAPLKIIWPTGPGTSSHLRINLVLLSVVDTVLTGVAMGAVTVMLYYSKLQFGWGGFESNMFVAFSNVFRVGALLTVLPCLNYFIRTRYKNRMRRESGVEVEDKQSGSDQLDLYIIRGSLLLELVGFVGFAVVRSGGLFFASGIITSLGGIGSPTLQSALTKHVPHDCVGQLLGATGLLHALARIICPTVFSLMYAATVNSFRQTVFVAVAACFALAFVVSWFIRPHSKLPSCFDMCEEAHADHRIVYLEEVGFASTNARRNTQDEQIEERIIDEEISGV